MCPRSWTHQRVVIDGGRPVAIGMTIRDITHQIAGPYTTATARMPADVAIRRRRDAQFDARVRNTADQVKATQTWRRIPTSAVRAPPCIADGPTTADATPCQSRVTVERYAKTLRQLAKIPSMIAIVIQVRIRRESVCRDIPGWRWIESSGGAQGAEWVDAACPRGGHPNGDERDNGEQERHADEHERIARLHPEEEVAH